jgi:predicted GNAT superfamily acetyltransferase
MSNPYRDYLIYKYDYEGSIDRDGAFLLYRIQGECLNIGEIFVPPQKRGDHLATKMADEVSMIAKAKGCKYLTCQTELTGKGDDVSMMAILSYGFKPYEANGNKIQYLKEVQ